MIFTLRRGALALCLAAALALAGGSARAVEAGPATKNFNVPPGVPDHFSNEAEPFKAGPAAEGPVPRSTVSRGPRSRRVAARHGRVEHGRTAHAAASSTAASRMAVSPRRARRSIADGRRSLPPSRAAHGHPAPHAKTAARPRPSTAKQHG